MNSMIVKEPTCDVDDFKSLIEGHKPFVDKTLFIRDMLSQSLGSTLFLRPTGFGKSLNLSMLRYFFSHEEGNNPKKLFAGLKIMECDQSVLSQMGQYPVVSISLETVEAESYELAVDKLSAVIAAEYHNHVGIIPKLDGMHQTLFQEVCNADLEDSLRFLSECLWMAYGKKTIVLVEDYDVPLRSAMEHGYCERMMHTLGNLFSGGFKSNGCLQFGVIMGSLPIVKSDDLAGILNNLAVYSVTSEPFSQYFGFSEVEVTALFDAYGFHDKLPALFDWCDGYTNKVLKPASVMQYLHELLHEQAPTSLTSSRGLVREICEKVRDGKMRQDIAALIKGKSIKTELDQGVTYGSCFRTRKSLYTLLLYTGYLAVVDSSDDVYTLRIPNKEVLHAYQDEIATYVGDRETGDEEIAHALHNRDMEKLTDLISERMANIMSFRSCAASFFHRFLLSLFGSTPGFCAVSQREVGERNPDILVSGGNGFHAVIECKRPPGKKATPGDLYVEAQNGLKQIDDTYYGNYFKGLPYIKIGCGFHGKSCIFLMDKPNTIAK